MPRLIKSESEHASALARIEQLMTAKMGTPDGDELELRVKLVELYEDEHFPIELPDPIAAIRFRMDQDGLSQQDLVPLIGGRGRVSEVMNGKRPLSLRMIRALHTKLRIPAESLIGEPAQGAALLVDDTTDWSRFPIVEIAKRGWLGDRKPAEAKEYAEELMRPFLEPLAALPASLYRQRVRRGSRVDEYALKAWVARVLNIAGAFGTQVTGRGQVDAKLVQQLLAFSRMESGPVLAQEFLAQNGIAMVVLRHLSKTHLDGAALAPASGPPIVALTLRHDRLDSFWFTLCHELAHLARHMDSSDGVFLDDLDATAESRVEREADSTATDWLIPPAVWKQSGLLTSPTTGKVLEVAASLRISPAIVAGRVRREMQNYRILSPIVGNGKVRQLFDNIDSGWPSVGSAS